MEHRALVVDRGQLLLYRHARAQAGAGGVGEEPLAVGLEGDGDEQGVAGGQGLGMVREEPAAHGDHAPTRHLLEQGPLRRAEPVHVLRDPLLEGAAGAAFQLGVEIERRPLQQRAHQGEQSRLSRGSVSADDDGLPLGGQGAGPGPGQFLPQPGRDPWIHGLEHSLDEQVLLLSGRSRHRRRMSRTSAGGPPFLCRHRPDPSGRGTSPRPGRRRPCEAGTRRPSGCR